MLYNIAFPFPALIDPDAIAKVLIIVNGRWIPCHRTLLLMHKAVIGTNKARWICETQV